MTAGADYAALYMSCEAAEAAGDDFLAAQRLIVRQMVMEAEVPDIRLGRRQGPGPGRKLGQGRGARRSPVPRPRPEPRQDHGSGVAASALAPVRALPRRSAPKVDSTPVGCRGEGRAPSGRGEDVLSEDLRVPGGDAEQGEGGALGAVASEASGCLRRRALSGPRTTRAHRGRCASRSAAGDGRPASLPGGLSACYTLAR